MPETDALGGYGGTDGKGNVKRRRPVEMIGKDVVDVWCAPFDRLMDALSMYERMLSPDEIDRANRFHSPRHRARYIAARGALREILSRYTDSAPRRLRFSYGAYGKPMLTAEESIRFNLSHSDGLVMYAVTRGREVGIDVERIRCAGDLDILAHHFFSARENAVYQSLREGLRREAFFACWTRKEAFVKARGRGLSLPLSAFDVAFAPGERAALLRVKRCRSEAARWTMHDISPEVGYKAALVIEGAACRFLNRPYYAPDSVMS